MVKVIWSDLSVDDLKSIHDFISQDSVRYADKMIDKIISRVDQLANFPNSGRIVPEFKNKKIRELILDNYRIVYTTHEKYISIARIHHSSRKID